MLFPPLQRAKSEGSTRPHGSLAQLVERFVYTEDVGSSSLSRPTIYHPSSVAFGPTTQCRFRGLSDYEPFTCCNLIDALCHEAGWWILHPLLLNASPHFDAKSGADLDLHAAHLGCTEAKAETVLTGCWAR